MQEIENIENQQPPVKQSRLQLCMIWVKNDKLL